MNSAEQRKLRSEEYIKSFGIEVNPYLPCITSDDQVRLRTPKEIAERIAALAYTNVLAFDTVSVDWVKYQISEHAIGHLFTPEEKSFIENPTQERKQYETWKVEAIWTLLWSINDVDSLDFPDHLVNLNDLAPGIYPLKPNEDGSGLSSEPFLFIQRHNTNRTVGEILDANDLYYRYYWACVDCRIHNRKMDIIYPSVVHERLRALNWIINYCDQEWDDVSTDT